MANQISISSFFFLILILIFIFTNYFMLNIIIFLFCGISFAVELILVESYCSKFLGTCKGIDCDKACKGLYSEGKGTCYFHNICQCFYVPLKDPSKDLRMCTLMFGDCNEGCDDSCCNARCSKNLKDGIGKCTIPFADGKVCVCDYSPS